MVDPATFQCRRCGACCRVPGYVALADAPCWTPAQAAFLREEILEDADWAEVVDQLDARLRA